jgi:hypothetical protein
MPQGFEGVAAFAGFLTFFAIRFFNTCAKLTIFGYHIFYKNPMQKHLF